MTTFPPSRIRVKLPRRLNFYQVILSCSILVAFAPLIKMMRAFYYDPVSIYPNLFDDSAFYFTKIKTVLEGDLSQSTAYLYSLSPNKPFGFEILGSIIVAFSSKIFQNEIFLGFVFSHALVIIFFVKFLIQALGDNKRSQLIASTSILLIVIFKPDYLYRPVLPALSVVAVPIFLYLRQWSMHHTTENRRLVPTLFASTLMYVNLFFALPMVLLQLFRNRQDLIRHILIVVITSAPLAWFALIPTMFSSSDDGFRWGVIASRAPGSVRETMIGISLLALVKLYSKRQEYPSIASDISSLLVATLILMNGQVFIGRSVEFGSHFGILINVIGFIIIPVAVFQIRSFPQAFISILITLVFISNKVPPSNILSTITKAQYLTNKSWIMDIARADLTNEVIVAIPETFDEYLPLYSQAKILYSARGITLFSMSNREAIERYLLNDFLIANLMGMARCRMDFPRAQSVAEEIFKRRLLFVDARAKTEERIFGFSQLRKSSATEMTLLSNQVLNLALTNSKNDFKSLILKYRPSRVVHITDKNGVIFVKLQDMDLDCD